MMQKEKFLLLYPGVLHSIGWGDAREPNTHLVYVYSFLKEHFQVTVLDLEREFGRPLDESQREAFKRSSMKRILSFDGELVGISCWSSMNYLAARYFAERIREARPKTRIVVGGYHPTFVEEDFRYPGSPFDVIVQGGVENTLTALGVGSCPARDPAPVRPDFRSYPYAGPGRNVGVFLSTGCPFGCTYCMEYRRKWRSFSVPEALEIVREVEETLRPKGLMILDACFGLVRQWRREFLTELAKRPHRCGFWLQTRIDLIDDEDLPLLAKLNLKLDLGVDSLSETMLNIMKKTTDAQGYLERFLDLSRKCSRLGIEHDAYLMFNHPGESRETLEEHEAFLRTRLVPQLRGGMLWIRSGTFSLFPGSFVFRHLDRFEEKYGTSVECAAWWREERDHLMLSRSIFPSCQKGSKPFQVGPERIRKPIADFNRSSPRVQTLNGQS
jgi:radical SAM superfamily enzyme YgiQ (UPF0313 family)